MKRKEFEDAVALKIPEFTRDIRDEDRATCFDDEPSMLLIVGANADNWSMATARGGDPATEAAYVAQARVPLYRDSVPSDTAALIADALEETDPATWGDESRPIFEDEPPRFVLSAGRHITDTLTGDEFNITGTRVNDGALSYDPTRLDALAREIVQLLNSEHRSTKE